MAMTKIDFELEPVGTPVGDLVLMRNRLAGQLREAIEHQLTPAGLAAHVADLLQAKESGRPTDCMMALGLLSALTHIDGPIPVMAKALPKTFFAPEPAAQHLLELVAETCRTGPAWVAGDDNRRDGRARFHVTRVDSGGSQSKADAIRHLIARDLLEADTDTGPRQVQAFYKVPINTGDEHGNDESGGSDG